jgi:predicted O-methyltransferase YrrM
MGAVMEFLQVEEEFNWFLDIIKREGCRSYLEVGAKFGECTKRVGEVIPVPSRLVTVDLPGGTKAWSRSEVQLKNNMAQLQSRGHDTHLIWGDSTDLKVVKRVWDLGPFDVVFIDANHTLEYVKKDWFNYGPMGRVVAFHDINWRRAPEWVGTRIDVPQFWDDIKDGYRHDEIRACPTGKNNGIGVLWRC